MHNPEKSDRGHSRTSSQSPLPAERIDNANDNTSEQSVDYYTELQKEIADFVVKMDLDEAGREQTFQSESEVDFYPGVERVDYDYAAERRTLYPTSLVGSSAHLLKGSLGAGLLAIHEAYMHGGIWTSLAVNVLLGTVATYNMLVLVRCAQRMYVRLRVPRLSYPDLMEAAVATGPMKCMRQYSKLFRYLVETFLFLELFGCCCIYQIMIASTAKYVLEKVSTQFNVWHLPLRMYVIIITAPILLLSMIKNLRLIVPLSIIGDFFVALCVIVTLYYSIAAAGKISERYTWRSVKGLLHVSGTCIYSMDGLTLALPVENSMDKPWYFPIVVHTAMPIIITTVAVVGFFGYWGWGENCRIPITTHMPLDWGIIILQVVLIVVLIVTFAVRFWVPFKIMYRYASNRLKVCPSCKQRDYYEIVMRLTLASVITVVSVTFPNIDQMISFLGNFFLAPITFVFPVLIQTSVFWKEHRRHSHIWVHITNALNITLGTFLCFGGVFMMIAGDHAQTTHGSN